MPGPFRSTPDGYFEPQNLQLVSTLDIGKKNALTNTEVIDYFVQLWYRILQVLQAGLNIVLAIFRPLHHLGNLKYAVGLQRCCSRRGGVRRPIQSSMSTCGSFSALRLLGRDHALLWVGRRPSLRKPDAFGNFPTLVEPNIDPKY